MYERNKLAEARYFLEQMKINVNSFYAFCYNLSAFLSATRSVLYLVKKEVTRTSYWTWYETKKQSQIVKFFIDKRNTSFIKNQ